MIEDFYLAAVPEQERMLGVPLRPLSLGHLILLNRVGSSFVLGGNPDFSDLAISVLICSLSYQEGLSIIYDHSDAEKAMRKWHAQITGERSIMVRLGIRKARVLDLHAECERFSAYLLEHSKMPYYSYNPGDFQQMHCPSVQIVKVRLMRDLHMPESELLDRSWRMCLWDYVTLKAAEGEIRMQDETLIESAQSDALEMAEAIRSGTFKMN